jgi:hypothetical protein
VAVNAGVYVAVRVVRPMAVFRGSPVGAAISTLL